MNLLKVLNNSSEDLLLDGFITFIHIDKNARPLPHGIIIEPSDPEDLALQEKAKNL